MCGIWQKPCSCDSLHRKLRNELGSQSGSWETLLRQQKVGKISIKNIKILGSCLLYSFAIYIYSEKDYEAAATLSSSSLSLKQVDEELDESMRLLNICSTVNDCMLQVKDTMHQLQSILRMKRETGITIEG